MRRSIMTPGIPAEPFAEYTDVGCVSYDIRSHLALVNIRF